MMEHIDLGDTCATKSSKRPKETRLEPKGGLHRLCSDASAWSKASEQLLPTLFSALLHQPLDLLRASTCGYHQSVGHVDNDDVVHTQQSDETSRPRNDDTAGNLLGKNCDLKD